MQCFRNGGRRRPWNRQWYSDRKNWMDIGHCTVLYCIKAAQQQCTVVSTRCVTQFLPSTHRKIRLIEDNTKWWCHLKKKTCKGTLRQVFICLWPRTPYSPPPAYTLYTCIIHRGMGRGGGNWTREKVRRATVHKPTWLMTDCISSLQTLINTCRKVPLQVNLVGIVRWIAPYTVQCTVMHRIVKRMQIPSQLYWIVSNLRLYITKWH